MLWGSFSATGVHRENFWAISNPYPCGTPVILSLRVHVCFHYTLVHLKGLIQSKAARRHVPVIRRQPPKQWKSEAPSTKPRELR